MHHHGSADYGSAKAVFSARTFTTYLSLSTVLQWQAKEPVLASFLHQNIISHSSLGKAMAVLLANKLSSRTLLGTQLMQLISEAYRDDPVCTSTKTVLFSL